jgi:hypothetical protein
VSNSEIIMIVGGLIAIVLGLVEAMRTDWQSLPGWGVAVLGATFVALALT